MKRKLCVILFSMISYFGVAQTANVKVAVSNNMLTVINTANNDTIISPSGQPLWEKFSIEEHYKSSYVGFPSIKTQTVANGCNLTYTFTNNTNETVTLGNIEIGGIRFDSIVKARSFENEGEELEYNHHNNTKTYTAYRAYYPRNLFSPVMTINGGKYTICISMLYPILDYKHNTYQMLQSFSNKKYNGGGKNWTAVFKLNACLQDKYDQYETDPAKYSVNSDLAPGETRTYTLCLRVITNANPCESWQGGLQPYKDYFRNKYGAVQYKTDRRPVIDVAFSYDEFCSKTNPYGFSNATINPKFKLRPDSFGYGPLAHKMIKICDDLNYKRIILVRPTGTHWHNTQLNYPPKSFSHWMEGDKKKFPHSYGHKMGDAPDSLRLIPSATREFGLCWGRAGTVMYDWDTSYYEIFNSQNPKHIAWWNTEFDLAIKTGAKVIELDQFRGKMPAWDGYVWLQMMKAKAPNVKGLTERWGCDFLQTLAGMYAINKEYNDVSGPHYLSDFLLPGTEKMITLWHQDTTEDMRIAKMKLFNSWGYVVSSSGDTLKEKFLAAQSWLTINPYPDLGSDRGICNNNGISLNGKCKNSVSYLWSTGAKTPSIKVLSPGMYWVKTTTKTGCTISDTVYLNTCKYGEDEYYFNDEEDETEIDSQKMLGGNGADLVNIYPNPSSDVLNMVNTSEENIKNIKLYNALGAFVAELEGGLSAMETVTIYVNDYPAGVYYLIIEGENNSSSKKLIIAK